MENWTATQSINVQGIYQKTINIMVKRFTVYSNSLRTVKRYIILVILYKEQKQEQTGISLVMKVGVAPQE